MIIERGWVLAPETNIFALTEKLVESVRDPMKEAIHQNIFETAVHYRDMMEYGDEKVQGVVIRHAESLRPRVKLSIPTYYWILAAREYTEYALTPYFSDNQVRLHYRQLINRGIATGENILIANGAKEGVDILASILGDGYVRFQDGVSPQKSESTEKMLDLAELDDLLGSSNARYLTADLLSYKDRMVDVQYFADNENIVAPTREERARYLTYAIMESNGFVDEYKVLYPEVLNKLAEVSKKELAQEITKRRRERLQK